jgi:hypothetical protein
MTTISVGFDQETGKAFISEGEKSVELSRKQVETAIVLLTALLQMDEHSDFVAYLVEPEKVEVDPEICECGINHSLEPREDRGSSGLPRSSPTPANHGDPLGDWENAFKEDLVRARTQAQQPDEVKTKPHKWNLDGACIACGMRETYLTIERGSKECKGSGHSTPSSPYSEFWGGYRGPWLG